MFHRFSTISLTTKILLGLVLGLIAGLAIKLLPQSAFINTYFVNGLFDIGGKLFIALLEMLIVPIVFVSLVYSTSNMGGGKKLGLLSIKTLLLFIFMTVVAILIGFFVALLFHVGGTSHLQLNANFHNAPPTPLKSLFIHLIPTNPVKSMAAGNLLQLIIFSIFLGIAISLSGSAGKRIAAFFSDLNTILMKLIMMIMKFAPYGVFFLIAEAFAKIGVSLLNDLALYAVAVYIGLSIQLFGVYSILLTFARLNPLTFFRKASALIVFAFSTSSSNASIPLNLETTEEKLGVSASLSSFIIPLGTNIHKDGTAVMQVIAAIFIAHIYHVHLTLASYIMMGFMVTLVSIGTAGVPSISVITLATILAQVGLPISGIGLIIGIDRFIDMMRTVVNALGNTAAACVIGQQEKEIDTKRYNDFDGQTEL